MQKVLELANDQVLTVRLFILAPVSAIVASASVPNVRVPTIVITSKTVPVLNPELGHADANIVDLSTWGPSVTP